MVGVLLAHRHSLCPASSSAVGRLGLDLGATASCVSAEPKIRGGSELINRDESQWMRPFMNYRMSALSPHNDSPDTVALGGKAQLQMFDCAIKETSLSVSLSSLLRKWPWEDPRTQCWHTGLWAFACPPLNLNSQDQTVKTRLIRMHHKEAIAVTENCGPKNVICRTCPFGVLEYSCGSVSISVSAVGAAADVFFFWPSCNDWFLWLSRSFSLLIGLGSLEVRW